jgi:hypothetical protein
MSRLPVPESFPKEPPHLSLVVNAEWFNYLLGTIDYLLRQDIWDGSFEDSGGVRDKLQELMDYMSADCSCIAALRFKRGVGLIAVVDGVDYPLAGSDQIGLEQDSLAVLLDMSSGVPDVPEGDSVESHICAGVRGLIEQFLVPRYKDVLDTAQLYVNGGITLAQTVVDIVDAMAFDAASIITPVDDIVSLVRTWETYVISNMLDVLNDPDWLEAIEESLYCAIKDAYPLTGELDSLTWDAWLATVGDFRGLQYHGFSGFATKYTFDQIRRRYNVSWLCLGV